MVTFILYCITVRRRVHRGDGPRNLLQERCTRRRETSFNLRHRCTTRAPQSFKDMVHRRNLQGCQGAILSTTIHPRLCKVRPQCQTASALFCIDVRKEKERLQKGE